METLQERLNHIAKEAQKIQNKYLRKYNLSLDYINIFSENSNEYDFYSEETLKLGTLLKEVANGIYVKLNSPINVLGLELKTIKVRKPDPTKNTEGAVDYVTNDYEFLKDQLQNNEDFQLSVNTFKQEEIVISIDESDAYVAVGSIPILETLKSSQPANTNDDSGLKQQLEDEKNKRLQLMSDFQNYQRRVEQDKAMFGAVANMSLIQEILEVFDDINLALTDNDLNLEHAKSSMKSAQDKLVTAIEVSGVERIPVSVGDDFDKEKMEAISTVAVTDDQKGKVIAVISSAFKYKNKDGVLKAAKVVVGK